MRLERLGKKKGNFLAKYPVLSLKVHTQISVTEDVGKHVWVGEGDEVAFLLASYVFF